MNQSFSGLDLELICYKCSPSYVAVKPELRTSGLEYITMRVSDLEAKIIAKKEGYGTEGPRH